MVQLANKSMSIETMHNTTDHITLYVEHIERCLKGDLMSAPEDQIKTILTFAVAFSGLANESHLKAFYQDLMNEDLKLVVENQRLAVEIRYVNYAHPVNIEIEENGAQTKYSYVRRFLDTHTSLALSSLDLGQGNHKNKNPQYEQLITRLYKEITGKKSSTFSKQRFLSQLFLAGQLMFRTKMPEFLWPIVTGKTFSGSSETESTYFFPSSPVDNKLDRCEPNGKPTNKLSHIPVTRDNLSPTTLQSDYDLIGEVINICKKEIKHKNRRKTVNKIKKYVSEVNTGKNSKIQDISLPASILIDYTLDGLQKVFKSGNNRWGAGKNTAVTYLGMLHHQWLSLFRNTSITELDEADFEEIYERIRIIVGTNKNKAIKDLLPHFFEFIVNNYSDTIAVPEFLSEENGIDFVRSRLISECTFQQCVSRMLDSYVHRTEHFRRSIEVLLILIYRLGLRPKEAFNIKLSNVSFGAVCEIEIHKNKWSGKSISANRRVEASLFLHDDELEKLRQLYNSRQIMTDKKNALLFSQYSSYEEPFTHDVVNKPATEILSELAGYRVVFYQCRSTFITNLVTICFASQEDSMKHTSYTDLQIRAIKEKFYVNKEIALDQISAFVGHLTPDTTLNSYVHLIELCILAHHVNTLPNLDLKKLSKLSKLTMKTLKTNFNIGNTDNFCLDQEKLWNCVLQRLSQYHSLKQKPQKTRQKVHRPAEHWKRDKWSIDTVIQIGELLSSGKETDAVADGLLLKSTYIEFVKTAINDLRNEGFKATQSETYVHPTVDNEGYEPSDEDDVKTKPTIETGLYDNDNLKLPSIKPSDRQEVINIATLLLSQEENAGYSDICKAFLSATPNHSYVKFSCVDELEIALKLLSKVCNQSRLLVTYDKVAKNEISPKVKQLESLLHAKNLRANNATVKDCNKFPDGRFFLHYLSESELVDTYIENNDDWHKYCSNALRVAFYWAEIYHKSLSYQHSLDLLNKQAEEMKLDKVTNPQLSLF